MDKRPISRLLAEQLLLADAAVRILAESRMRATPILEKALPEATLSPAERETLEALTSRFSRLSDLLFQRLFRTLDAAELIDEGSNLDRLHRMEKRGIISSVDLWRDLRELRNQIAHEYLIRASAEVVKSAYKYAPEVIQTVDRMKAYVVAKDL